MRRDSLKRLIPITALRSYYGLLRRFPSTAFHLHAARECLRRPDQLAKLVETSLVHASLYDNGGEHFHARTGQGALSFARKGNNVLANQLLRLLVDGNCEVASSPHLEFDYVDYEICPLRTTKSEFEDGRVGKSSRGGVDLLLANRADQLPAIAEIKADTDRNPFLGLIQALTYAVEVGTVTQRTRLDHFYRGRFAWDQAGPALDLYLLLLRYPGDQIHAEFFHMTEKIAGHLLEPGSPVSRLVRRIVALHTPVDRDDRVIFTVGFAHGS